VLVLILRARGAAAPGEIGVLAGESQASISARSPAKVIGLTIPEAFLLRADEVIE
jgi:hypothetical protein